jgi:hypothetical protein
MNRYIKKCLIVYTTLALVLIGMAGVSYAITATDANRYLTRSQFATDMNYLQTLLDEKESGLMGQINKYRSTDVKFVTYDSPTHYNSAASLRDNDPYSAGYHTGGNYFPRKRYNASGWQYQRPWYTQTDMKTRPTTYSIYRLWDGDYFIGKNLFYQDEATTNPNTYEQCVNFAIPAENYPGWYMVLYIRNVDSRTMYRGSLVKLDPNVPMPDSAGLQTMTNSELIFRLKKDLFIYTADNTSKITNTTKPALTGYNTSWYNTTQGTSNNLTYHPFTRTVRAQDVAAGTVTVYSAAWLDPVTGDYMVALRNIMPCGYANRSNTYSFVDGGQFWRWLPADNVEYVCGNTNGLYTTSYSGAGWGYPAAELIGTGKDADQFWEYEFVDCVNGLTYWHAYKPPANATKPGASPPGRVISPAGIHYSLPIVY